MPQKIHDVLAAENETNKVHGVVPKIAQLLTYETDVEVAYLCADMTVQVSKIPSEGNTFCGYRNIQTLLRSQSDSRVWNTIFSIQDMIERAWDKGHYAQCREQIGPLHNTRTLIGTLEVAALLEHLDIPHTVQGFYDANAEDALLGAIWDYFSSPDQKAERDLGQCKLYKTQKAPVFLQRPGHSITVVGIERRKDRTRRLLIFDPAWQPPSLMRNPGLLSEAVLNSRLRRFYLLQRYRKPRRYLRPFNAFEVVFID
jgi:zinc finger-containing ubiquitin peptidase 1